MDAPKGTLHLALAQGETAGAISAGCPSPTQGADIFPFGIVTKMIRHRRFALLHPQDATAEFFEERPSHLRGHCQVHRRHGFLWIHP